VRLREINALAPVTPAQRADVDLSAILDLRAFDPARAAALDPQPACRPAGTSDGGGSGPGWAAAAMVGSGGGAGRRGRHQTEVGTVAVTAEEELDSEWCVGARSACVRGGARVRASALADAHAHARTRTRVHTWAYMYVQACS
jgi:G3E family GTPase